MGPWYSIPLVIAGLASMAAAALVLGFTGLPYTPLDQVLSQGNPYGDPRLFVAGQVLLQGGDQQELLGSTVVISRPDDSDPITVVTASDGSFVLSLAPGEYRLKTTRTGWASQTLEFVLAGGDLNLEPIRLLLDTVRECPGGLPGEDGSPLVLGVTTNLNPTNSLIQNFDVQLSEAGEAWVEYYPKNNSGKVLTTAPTPNLDTAQQIQVMRLAADTEYCYQVYSRANSGEGPVSDSFPGQFATGPLPEGLADSIFNKTIGTQTYDLTLLDFNDADFTGMVALDEDAKIVWYYEHASQVYAVDQKENFNLVFGQIDGQKMVEMKPDGTVVDQITDLLEDGTPCAPAGRWHHESQVQTGDKVLFLGSEIRDVNINGDVVPQTGDLIMEWDQNQGTVSTLAKLHDLLDPATERTEASGTTGGFFYWQGCDREVPAEDWTHSNSIWAADNGTYIVSVRHLNQIIAIAPDLQSVLWRLGGPNSSFIFRDPNDQFYHQHSAKLLPNGNLLLFDNGNVRPEAEGGQYSRALELELDLDTMEAREVWQYRFTPDLFADCCSSVQRLENGNTVLVFGSDTTREACCRVFNVVEADAQQATVSAIEIASPGKPTQYRVYALGSINGESKK